MCNGISSDHQRIVQKILSYFETHPHAADSANGIAGWWVKQPLHRVLPALEFLVGEQLVEKLETGDGYVYRNSRSGRRD